MVGQYGNQVDSMRCLDGSFTEADKSKSGSETMSILPISCGEYLGRIYDETKKRPLYLIEQTWGIDN